MSLRVPTVWHSRAVGSNKPVQMSSTRAGTSGEITSEQYEEVRETLGSSPRDQQPPSPVGTPG
jgi:hypothetical protein